MPQLDETKLFQAALHVRNNSYSPYSKYKVASAVLGNNEKIYAGVNVENASYGATICAERTAIVAAIADGCISIKAVMILTDENEPWPPCGMCRQVMVEFCKPETTVILANLKGPAQRLKLSELVPHSFNKEKLDL